MNSRDVEDFYDSVTAQPPDDAADVPTNYDDMPMPSLEKIVEMIQGMQGMSDEEKNSLLQSVLSQSQSNMDLEQLNLMRSTSPSYQFMVLFGLLCVLALIFVFFGYKLYKSLTEKEKKREEKRKQKQMKKKK